MILILFWNAIEPAFRYIFLLLLCIIHSYHVIYRKGKKHSIWNSWLAAHVEIINIPKMKKICIRLKVDNGWRTISPKWRRKNSFMKAFNLSLHMRMRVWREPNWIRKWHLVFIFGIAEQERYPHLPSTNIYTQTGTLSLIVLLCSSFFLSYL